MAKEKTKVTAKSVICGGIEKGKSVKFILGQVEKRVPDSKADENHIKHYARKMSEAGEINEKTKAIYIQASGRGRPAGKDVKKKVKKATSKSKGKKS